MSIEEILSSLERQSRLGAPTGGGSGRGVVVRLESLESAWIVAGGEVGLFAVDLGVSGDWEGISTRKRLPLGVLQRGDLALGVSGQGQGGLILVGLDDESRVVEIPKEILREAAQGDFRIVAEGIESWLESMGSALDIMPPTVGEALTVGGEVEIGEGRCAWPISGAVWLSLEPDLTLCGGAWDSKGRSLARQGNAGAESDTATLGISGGNSSTVGLKVPVAPGFWVCNTGLAREVVPEEGASALAEDSGWAGLKFVQSELGIAIGDLIAKKAKDWIDRLGQLTRYEKSLTSQSFSGLAALLDKGFEFRNTSESHDNLVATFELVARALGVDFERPPARLLLARDDPVDALARWAGFRYREVVLSGSWWKQDCGPLLAQRAEGSTFVALIPHGIYKYDLIDPASGTVQRIDEDVASELAVSAYMFYRPLPKGTLSGKVLLRYMLAPMKSDLIRISIYSLLVGAFSLVTPLVTRSIFSSVVPGLQRSELVWLAALMILFAFSSFALGMAQQFTLLRIQSRGSTDLQAAIWDRVLDLRLPFFRQYSSGSLAMRVMGIEQIRSLATTTVTSAMLSLSIAIFNLGLAFVIQPRLALFGLLGIAIIIFVFFQEARKQVKFQRQVQLESPRLFGIAMEMVGSVGKLQAASAETRAFSVWAERFRRLKEAFFSAQVSFVGMLSYAAAATGFVTALIFIGAASLPVGAITAATFIAFNTAFTQVIGSITSSTSIVTFIAQAIPVYDNLKPVIQERPQSHGIKTDPGILRGEIEVSHVSFRYGPQSPPILEDINFAVRAGEMVAIVGPSGSGKSTLLRLLLGFEDPDVGSVRFDGKDLDGLDLRSVRRQIGVVLQNAALNPGDIFSNIAGTRQVTMEEAWEAARIAGIEEEIRAMPMGMHTFIAEGSGTISGGQKQRILIARAVAGKPRMVFFDEATSALDNETQRQVSEALARLRATRVVIAHRLSTVVGADRILVVVGGHLVQSGSYEELMEDLGPFRELAGRQLLA